MADENKTLTPVEEIKATLGELKGAMKTLSEQGKINGDIEARCKAIEEDLKNLEKKTVERQLSVPGIEAEKKKFDLSMAVKAAKTGKWDEAGFELECIKATHEKALKIGYRTDDPALLHKDLTAGTGSQGGFLLSVETDQSIIPLAIADQPILNDMGITRMNNLGVGEYRINKQLTRGQGYWIGELQAPTKSTQTFDQRILRMKKLAAYSAASNDLLRQGRGTMDSFLVNDLKDAMGLAMETALLRGTGSDYQPKGIINYTGLTTTSAIGANGGNLGIRKAAEMVLNIRKANLLKGKLGFVTSPEVIHNLSIQGFTSISNQTSNTGPLNGQVPLSRAQLESLTGYKMRDSTLLPVNLTKGSSSDCTYVIFGDWSQVVMGMWGGLEVKISDLASDGVNNMFVQDGFFVHVLQTMDIVLRDEAALTMLSDARVAIAEVV